MRKSVNREELEKRVKYLDAQNGLLNQFLHDTVTARTPDAAVTVPEGKTTTIYRGVLYRADSGSGGYVVLSREWGGQTASSVHLLDDLGDQRWPLEVRILAERLTVARTRLLGMPVIEKQRVNG